MYVQHNPAVTDGTEAFIAYSRKTCKYPGKRVEFSNITPRG